MTTRKSGLRVSIVAFVEIDENKRADVVTAYDKLDGLKQYLAKFGFHILETKVRFGNTDVPDDAEPGADVSGEASDFGL